MAARVADRTTHVAPNGRPFIGVHWGLPMLATLINTALAVGCWPG